MSTLANGTGFKTTSSAATSTFTPTASPTAGRIGLFVVHFDTTGKSSSAPTQTNCTWSLALRDNTDDGCTVEVWYTLIGSSPGTTLNCAQSSGQRMEQYYVEIDTTTNTFDQAAASFTTGSDTIPTGSITTTVANCVLIGVFGYDTSYNIHLGLPGWNASSFASSFTKYVDYQQHTSSGFSLRDTGIIITYRDVSATGTYSTNAKDPSVNDSGANGDGIIVSFKGTSTAVKRLLALLGIGN